MEKIFSPIFDQNNVTPSLSQQGFYNKKFHQNQNTNIATKVISILHETNWKTNVLN